MPVDLFLKIDFTSVVARQIFRLSSLCLIRF